MIEHVAECAGVIPKVTIPPNRPTRPRKLQSPKAHSPARNTATQFCPPNPKALAVAARTGMCRATFGT